MLKPRCPQLPAGLAIVVATFGVAPLLADPPGPNALSPAEQEAGWRLLFDGETLNGWRGYHSAELPEGWRAEDGTLHFAAGSGDLITVDTFGNFELSLEWKISEGGNSGIFYLAAPGSETIYMSAPEMQVLDDARHPDGANPLTSAGAAYGLYPAPRGVVRPVGEWNSVRIRVQDGQVQHWLNGQEIVEYVLGSPEWTALVANSKFADWPEYGKARAGHVGLQDHGDPVWFRDIRIRILE